MADEFTQRGYKTLLEEFAKRDYKTTTFRDCCAHLPHLILRHDIDMSISAALPIARIEAELGMQAHYFILLRSELYNPFASGFFDGISKICEMGHEIGLHFDASLYPDDPYILDQAAQNECSIFEHMIGKKINIVSFHRPANSLLGLRENIGGRIHSYQPKYFEEIGYVSDSRGGWYHGHPLKHDAVQNSKAIQLLTHPIWWTETSKPGPVEKLLQFVDRRDADFRNQLAANCEPFRDVICPERTIAPK